MTLNSAVSCNKMKDSVCYQIPKTATICRAPEGIQRKAALCANIISPWKCPSTLPGVLVSSESLVRAARWSCQVFERDNSGSKKAPVFKKGEAASFLCMIYFDYDFWICYMLPPTPPPPSELFTDDCWQLPYFLIRTWVEWVYGGFLILFRFLPGAS